MSINISTRDLTTSATFKIGNLTLIRIASHIKEFEFGIRLPKRPFTKQKEIWALVRDTLIVETELDILSQADIQKLDADL